MTVPLSLLGSVWGQILFFSAENNILSGLSDCLLNLSETCAMNESLGWNSTSDGGLIAGEASLWLMLLWLMVPQCKETSPMGSQHRKNEVEGLVNFFGLWEGFYELRDPDNEWVSMSIAPVDIHKYFHTSSCISYSFKANMFATCQS